MNRTQQILQRAAWTTLRMTCLMAAVTAIALASVASADTNEDITAQEEAAFKAAAQAIAPAVVRIETFGGAEKIGGVLVGTGPTTGLVVSEDGYLLSSAFNFIQKPSSILVTLPSGKRAAASIVARDHSRMLVLLKVTTDEKLVVPAAIARDQMQVGQWAIAVGRTFEQPLPSISVGILSATNRIWGKAIQADAKISPSNYGGPLIDIQGRVLGILVPMSPQAGGEVAGAEWYDSGIGFAVPLHEMLPRLETLKSGKDLHPGLIGISLKQGDTNADPATIVACQPKGPADKAGLKAQDIIIAFDGQPIERQVQLKHALGPKYAGDRVRVTVKRGDETLEKEIELVEALEPYQHPLVGILPLRDKPTTPGVAVRYVLPDSPAAEAGLVPGDRILALGETKLADAAAMVEALAAYEVGAQVKLHYVRGDQEKTADITLAAMTAEIPAELPASHGQLAEAAERPNVGIIEIKIPEEQNECSAYVPSGYHPAAPHGVLVALHQPGVYDRDKLIARYKPLCDQHEIILLLPKAADINKWQTNDAAFIKKAIDDVAAHYNVDGSRVAITGYSASGSMAWLTALANSDTIRAVVAIEAPLPAALKLAEAEPATRRWFWISSSTKSPQRSAIAATSKRFAAAKLPLVEHSTGDDVRDLNAEELMQLGRWLDSLDRL